MPMLATRLMLARPKRRRLGPIPAPLPLDGIQAAYYSAIIAITNRAHAAFAKAQDQILADLIEQRGDTERTDAPDRKRWFPHRLPPSSEWQRRSEALDARRALHLTAVAQATFEKSLEPTALHAVVARFGKRTNTHQREQLDRQLRSAIGVGLGQIEKPVRDHLTSWATENVNLIRTVPQRYFARLRAGVEEAYASGMHPTTLAKRFADVHDISLNDAMRIAVDQIGKLNGQLNRERQTSIGIEDYMWRGVRDSRERDNHNDLEGVRCSWSDPPMGGGTDEDEAGHPGSGIQCRCYPEPVLDHLIRA